MRRFAATIAVTAAFGIAFWPFAQMADAEEMEWCSNLHAQHDLAQAGGFRDGDRATDGDYDAPDGQATHARPQFCCHQSAFVAPTLVKNQPAMIHVPLAYVDTRRLVSLIPASPFRGIEVPPG